MSQKIPVLTLAVLAAAAIPEFTAVAYDGTVPAAGAAMQGVATTDATGGDTVAVDVLGTTIATAGGAVAAGAELEVGTAGKLVTKTTGVTVGRALEVAGADGDLIEIMLLP